MSSSTTMTSFAIGRVQSGEDAGRTAPVEAASPCQRRAPGPTKRTGAKPPSKMVLDTVDALFHERDDSLWGSMVKQTLKRKRPNFSESFHGYRSFNQLLEDARDRGLLELQKDERSGGYLILSFGPKA